jgi:hypothetical protein
MWVRIPPRAPHQMIRRSAASCGIVGGRCDHQVMYDTETRRAALLLIQSGVSLNRISRCTGISRATLRSWRDARPWTVAKSTCVRCQPHPSPPAPGKAYAYVLGLYLGDGCISAGRRGVYALRICCADAWPGLIAECSATIKMIRPTCGVSLVQRQGCKMVTAYWKHWPCLFPQHGPGEKHRRAIVLEPWQQNIVDEYAEPFLRGPFPFGRLPYRQLDAAACGG